VTRARSLIRAARGARARRGLVAAVAALAALAWVAPAPASPAGKPEITAAGIDATDRFVVSWRLEPGTTFDFLQFSTVAISNPFVPGSFAGMNVVASACVAPGDGCTAPPTLSVFRSADRVARDRRYFVKVNARRDGRGPLSSDVWVIDQAKPLLPGGGRPTDTPTNTPVLGKPYVPPARNTIPPPRLRLDSPPKKIADVLRRGVRAHVTCPLIACYVVIGIKLGKFTLVFSDATARASERETFVLRPRGAGRTRLKRRTRARLELLADVIHPGGKRTRISRRFSVRR
jgi:hypothetical protein